MSLLTRSVTQGAFKASRAIAASPSLSDALAIQQPQTHLGLQQQHSASSGGMLTKASQYAVTKVDSLVNWARKGSMWPMTFGESPEDLHVSLFCNCAHVCQCVASRRCSSLVVSCLAMSIPQTPYWHSIENTLPQIGWESEHISAVCVTAMYISRCAHVALQYQLCCVCRRPTAMYPGMGSFACPRRYVYPRARPC